jgi:hypothetical protein
VEEDLIICYFRTLVENYKRFNYELGPPWKKSHTYIPASLVTSSAGTTCTNLAVKNNIYYNVLILLYHVNVANHANFASKN